MTTTITRDRLRRKASPALLFLFTLASAATAEDRHPLTIHDMLAMQRVGDVAVSAGGTKLAFTVRTTDVAANTGRYDVWLVDAKEGGPRRLTSNVANDTSPRFSRDDLSIYFLSSRSGSSQIWSLSLMGGEPTQITDLPLDIDNFLVFPDGRRFLVSMEVYPDAKDLAETAARDEAKAKSKMKAKVYDSLLFRHWDQWEDGKRSHWFTLDAVTGKATDLMAGMPCDAPNKPFGGAEEATIRNDGKTVVFATTNMGREAAWSTNVDLYSVPSDGSAAPTCLTTDNPATDNLPQFSPDGRFLAYVAMKRPMYESDRQGLMIREVESGKVREIAPNWDRSASGFTWSRDGKTLYATADHIGNTGLFAVDVGSGTVKPLIEKGAAGGPVAIEGGVAFLWNDMKHPDEIHTLDAAGNRKVLTAINAPLLEKIAFGDYEQYSFKGAHDDTVYGYVMKPWNYESGKKYPVAFLIHGGPQGSFSDHFHYRWNAEAFAGRGLGVVFVDFHGSTGYGQAFCDSIRGDWGGAPYEDLMKGLDAALAKYSFLDGSRVAAAGASYGGYMINWIAGQTDRFKCLVCHDGNLDNRMAYLDTEELWFDEWEHHGTPWENPDAFSKHNPIDFIKNWKTPTLVLHGGNDFRVVDTHGMATFTALQRKGIPSKFVFFPDENHWVLKPQNSILWHDSVLDWIDQWTKSPPAK